MIYKRGFTLVELIVSILIFSLAMTGIVMFSASNNRRIIQSEKRARLSVHGEKSFEDFRGMIMQETPSDPNRLVFDSIWETHAVDDTLYKDVDTVKGMVINSAIILDSFEFSEDSPIASGSRIRCIIITKDNFGDYADSTIVLLSRHR
jgi:prepilin-type N-terminal cleavage/methylation domain-containing protein